MNKIIISIKPEYVRNILNGTKRFEYRTRIAKKPINSLIIYSTSPDMHVVAEVKVLSTLMYTPDILWSKTKKHSGISRKQYDLYFENREVAYAYVLGDVTVFAKPKDLIDYGIRYAPQSYVYV